MEPTDNTDPQSDFISTKSQHLIEVKGTIALLIDSISAVESELRFNKGRPEKPRSGSSNTEQFYKYFYRVVFWTRQIVAQDLLKEVNEWLDSFEYDINTKQELVMDGIKLAKRYDDALFDAGIKDTNITHPTAYPFRKVLEMSGIATE